MLLRNFAGKAAAFTLEMCSDEFSLKHALFQFEKSVIYIKQ